MTSTQQPTVSIITVCYNAKDTIGEAIQSIASQTYPHIEHIIVDGQSNDGTQETIRENFHPRLTQFISETDTGIYDAMNKGLQLAKGDIIGFLNADDLYDNPEVIKMLVEQMETLKVDCCFGDLVYISRSDPQKFIATWKSTSFKPNKFRRGWMPPHPTFFVRKKIFERYGGFKTTLKISADYEMMLRFLECHKISHAHISKVMVRMRIGGTSNKNLRNLLRGSYEVFLSWKINRLKISPWTIPLKSISKIYRFSLPS